MSDLHLRTLDGATISVSADEAVTLGGSLWGELLVPSDPGYDQARAVWNGAIDRRPGAIARWLKKEGRGDIEAAVAVVAGQGVPHRVVDGQAHLAAETGVHHGRLHRPGPSPSRRHTLNHAGSAGRPQLQGSRPRRQSITAGTWGGGRRSGTF